MSEHDSDFLTSLKENPVATVAKFYAAAIKNNENAIDFATAELEIEYDDLVEKQIGVGDRTLGKLIPHSRIKQGRELR